LDDAELHHHGEPVQYIPVPGDLAILEGKDVHAIVFYAFSCGGNPHKLASMRALEGEIVHDFISLGNGVVYGAGQIRKSFSIIGKERFHPLSCWCKTRYFTVIDKVGTQQLIDGLQVVFVLDLFIKSTADGFVSFEF
jgi:hypothetical protein